MNKILVAALVLCLHTSPIRKAFSAEKSLPSATESPITVDLGGIKSIYTRPLVHLVQSWPKKIDLKKLPKAEDIEFQCFQTPGNDYYIGVGQKMVVNVPFKNVEAVLDDFKGYVGIFDGLKTAEILEKSGNRFVFFSEQAIPFPFVANEKNEMYYVTSHPGERKIYRYQLKSSNHMNFNDGVLIIEVIDSRRTLYSEFDFWDIAGVVRSFPSTRVWKDSMEGVYQSDAAIRMKAEHPDWTAERILEESKKASEKQDFEALIKTKKTFGGKETRTGALSTSVPPRASSD